MRNISEYTFTGDYTGSYSPNTMSFVGTWLTKYTGSTADQNYVSLPLTVCRPGEQSTAIPGAYPHVVNKDSNTDYVFLAESSAAGATRRIILYEFDKLQWQFNWKGFITLTFPTATNHTIRGLRAIREPYVTGSVEVNGVGVTGSSTVWVTDQMTTGSRIGFGSTNPAAISNWYPISQILSNTQLNLMTNAGTYPASTPYVIEDWKLAVVTTNATVANGGLFLVKGLRPELFISAGTTIGPATTTDNSQSVYWLADASTVLNTVAGGCGIDDRESWNSQSIYVIDGTTTDRVYKYNIRAPLTGLASGKSTSAFVLRTGTEAVTGTTSQTNNGRIFAVAHGVANGVKSLYFATTTRVYRASLGNITSNNSPWTSDVMLEVPTGGTGTQLTTATLNAVEYASSVDRLVITTTTKQYLTRYQTAGSAFDETFWADSRLFDSTTADTAKPLTVNPATQPMNSWVEGGIMYAGRSTTTANLSEVYAIPFSSHWSFPDTMAQLISPKISLPSNAYLKYIYPRIKTQLGIDPFILPTNNYELYIRTSGIDDNSGAWTLVGDSGDLSGLSTTSTFQVRVLFEVFGLVTLPPRVYGFGVSYEVAPDLPSQFLWNMSDSSTANGTVGFIQHTQFGSAVPGLTIEYYRRSNDALLLSQNSTGTTNGVFQYWNGATWVAGLGTDTIDMRRRFVPSSGLTSGEDIYIKISLT